MQCQISPLFLLQNPAHNPCLFLIETILCWKPFGILHFGTEKRTENPSVKRKNPSSNSFFFIHFVEIKPNFLSIWSKGFIFLIIYATKGLIEEGKAEENCKKILHRVNFKTKFFFGEWIDQKPHDLSFPTSPWTHLTTIFDPIFRGFWVKWGPEEGLVVNILVLNFLKEIIKQLYLHAF